VNLNEYQNKAQSTANYPVGTGFTTNLPPGLYTALGLNGEAGEVAEKIKKYWRDGGDFKEVRAAIKKELGDTLWYLSETARQWELTLEEVAQGNLEKLSGRKERGTLKGSGDDR
jgi:NTP pyrophosphatase (non-canonical NTP hydrolase)